MEPNEQRGAERGQRGWGLITTHAHVLLAIAGDPEQRVSEIAGAVGITKRYAYRVLSDLQQAGYVRRSRRGRCNHYRLNLEFTLPGRVEEQPLRQLLRLIGQREQRDLLVALTPQRPSLTVVRAHSGKNRSSAPARKA